MDAAAGLGERRFSTDFLKASERTPYFREVIGRSMARADLIPIEGRPLKWSMRAQALDGLVVVSTTTTGLVARRAKEMLSDGNDDLLFGIKRSGFSSASQIGRECAIPAGAAALLSSADPYAHIFPGPDRSLVLRIPRHRIADLVAVPEDTAARLIPASTESLRLLVDYVEMGLRRHRLASPELRQLFATHVRDLVALAIGATRDAAEIARGRGLAAARLNAAKRYIRDRLDDEGLIIANVAGRLGVTPRYLQMLFEAEGTTFTEYVLKQRLAQVHRMLSDPRFFDRTVTTIVFDGGFGSLSYFHRAFRRAYGATPSDIRATARQGIR
jgi:AraC-like DNA-binding protein